MRRSGLLLFALAAAAWFAPQCAGAADHSESKHFVVHYEGEDSRYIRLVLDGLEAAYDLFVQRSLFETFPGTVDVRIPRSGMEGMGTEYLETNAKGDPVPVIEIAPETAMREATRSSSVGLTLEEAVGSTAAHEFFHVLQDYAALQGQGDAAEASFIEPLATAVQEVAAPGADDYLDAAIDLFFAPDATSFFDRGYDGGLFWVFVIDRYGVQTLRGVMAASAAADGAQAVDRAFASRGMGFLEVWVKFIAAWATASLPDQEAVVRYTETWRRELGLESLSLPAPIVAADWTGRPASLDRVTEETPANAVLGYSDASLGSALKIAHPYGLDVVSIAPASSAALAMTVVGSESTDFRVVFAGRRDAAWELLSFSGRSVTVRAPIRYDEIRIWITRGEAGSGNYTVRLSPAP